MSIRLRKMLSCCWSSPPSTQSSGRLHDNDEDGCDETAARTVKTNPASSHPLACATLTTCARVAVLTPGATAAWPQAEGNADFAGDPTTHANTPDLLGGASTIQTHSSAHGVSSSRATAVGVASPAAVSNRDDPAGHPRDVATGTAAAVAAPSSSCSPAQTAAAAPVASSLEQQRRGSSSAAELHEQQSLQQPMSASRSSVTAGPQNQGASLRAGVFNPQPSPQRSEGESNPQSAPQPSAAWPDLQPGPQQQQLSAAASCPQLLLDGVSMPSGSGSGGARPRNILLFLADMKQNPEASSSPSASADSLLMATAPAAFLSASSERRRSIMAPNLGGHAVSSAGGSRGGGPCDRGVVSEEALQIATERAAIRQRFLQGKLKTLAAWVPQHCQAVAGA